MNFIMKEFITSLHSNTSNLGVFEGSFNQAQRSLVKKKPMYFLNSRTEHSCPWSWNPLGVFSNKHRLVDDWPAQVGDWSTCVEFRTSAFYGYRTHSTRLITLRSEPWFLHLFFFFPNHNKFLWLVDSWKYTHRTRSIVRRSHHSFLTSACKITVRKEEIHCSLIGVTMFSPFFLQ